MYGTKYLGFSKMKRGVPTKNPEFGVNMKYFWIFFETYRIEDVTWMTFTYIFANVKFEGKEIIKPTGNRDMFILIHRQSNQKA
jgi:hypothetical protein